MKRLGFALAAGLMASAALGYDGEHYVTCNLDPNGDNWVALKAAPDISSRRLMKMGPNTFLLTMDPEPVGKWRWVIVVPHAQSYDHSGPVGWVYTDYICRINF